MKASEFAKWIDSARELGATHLEVSRARQNGGSASTVFFRETMAALDVERLVERMHEDIASKARRLSRATFVVLGFRLADKERVEVMRDTVTVTRDDDEQTSSGDATTVEGASVEMQRAAFAAAREAHRDLRDMAMGAMQTLQGVAENLSGKLVESQDKVAAVLQVAFEFSTLQHEREESERASRERRELGKVAIEELAPIVGATLAHVTKNATPAWAGFAKRLQTSGKLPSILELLDAEEVAALGAALGLTFPPKQSEKKEAKEEATHVEVTG